MHKIVIDGDRRKFTFGFQEIFEYKDLLFTLARRDFKVRYSQTFLGVLWAAIQPLTTLLIFSLVFGRVAKIDTGSIPYPVFAIVGMSAWTYFSFVLGQAGSSVISAQHMISKTYFPRLIIPISKAIVGLVDLGISLLLVITFIFAYDVHISANVIWLPVFIILSVVAGLTAGIWLSAITVRFRDFQQIIPFLVQIGLYATPVAYPARLVPEKYHAIYYLNPMAGIVEGFRWSLIGTEAPDSMAIISAVLLLVLFFSGLYYFRSVEKIMADIV